METHQVNVLNQQIDGNYALYQGDCNELIKGIPDESVGFSIFSPPFAQMYCYSDSERDMGNSKNYDEFFTAFKFLISELMRTLKKGRLVSVHCMDLPTSKVKDGYIGLTDFRGHIIKAFQDAGFIYHSAVTIWRDPVVQMQRTKALGLLHKTIRKDSSMSRMGLPDYVVTFRKPGINDEPIEHNHENFPVALWQEIASPVWMTTNQTNTLQKESARDNEDEKHICCLQLDVIERCLMLWSNPGDIVLDPFNGIGSSGYVALKMQRRYVGFELKESYFNCAVTNLRAAANNNQLSLFG